MRSTSAPLPLFISGSLIDPIFTLEDKFELESRERELLSLIMEYFRNSVSLVKEESLILCWSCF